MEQSRNAAIEYLQGAGWTREQAIGIAANLQHESSFNPGAIGDGGRAYGIAQWHPDRQAAFQERFGKSIRGSSMEEQLDFLTYEMKHGKEQAAGKRLSEATDAASAARVVSQFYERPADVEGAANKRAATAAKLAGVPYVPAAPLTPKAAPSRGPDWPVLPTARAAQQAANPLPMDANAIAAQAVVGPVATMGTAGASIADTESFIQRQNATQARMDATGFIDAFQVARHDPRIQIGFNLLDRLNREEDPAPEGWTYASVRDEVEAGRPDHEREYLRENGTSPSAVQQAVAQLAYRRELDETYGYAGGFSAFAGQMAGGLMDPVGLMAGLGVGKALQLAGVGSHALAAAGRVTAGRASFVAENVIGNVGVEALQDALGEVKGSGDYAMAAAMGTLFAAPFVPLVRAGNVVDEAADAAARAAAGIADKAAEQTVARTAAGLEAGQPARDAIRRETDEILGELDQKPHKADQAVPEDVQQGLRAEVTGQPTGMEEPTLGAVPVDEPPVAGPDGVTVAKEPIQPIVEPAPERTPEQIQEQVKSAAKGESEVTIGKTKEGDEVRFKWRYEPKPKAGDTDLRTTLAAVLQHPKLPADLRTIIGYLQKRASKDVLDKVAVAVSYRKPGSRIAGKFDPNSGRIDVKPQGPGKPGDKRTAAERLLGADEDTLRTFIHEVMHAVTHAKLYAFAEGKADKALKDTFKTLDLIFDEFRRKVKEDSPWGARYAATDLKEFVAQAWSDPETQRILASIESDTKPGRSLWGRVLEAITKAIFGGADMPAGRLADVLRLTDSIIRADGVTYLSQNGTPVLYATLPPQVLSAARNRRLELIVHHARQFMARNPINKERLQVLSRLAAKYGGMSDGLVLARSENPVAQMIASLVTETTTGAAGRKQTVAVRTKFMKEKLIGNGLLNYQRARDDWHKTQGTDFRDRYMTGEADRRFGGEVFKEINRRRQNPGYTSQGVDRSVVEAADVLEEGFQRAADAQRAAGTLGADRLDMSSRGYIPQALDGKKLAAMDFNTYTALTEELGRQFASNLGWDTRFASLFAQHYLERARRRSLGDKSMDALAASSDGMRVVRDTLAEMGRDPNLRDKAAAASAGLGQGHTKRRLTVDMDAPIGNGTVMDAYVTDPVALYRRYMHGTAGNIALTESGILGVHGVRELRSAATSITAGSPPATKLELDAMDRVFAEVLGTPTAGEVVSAGATNLGLLVGLQRLGGLVFTQANESWNMIHHVGLANTLKGIATLPRLIGEVRASYKTGSAMNPILRSLEVYGGEIGMEGHKMVMPLDAPDMHLSQYMEQPSTVTRLLRAGGHAQAIATGFRTLLAAQHRMAAEQITMKALRYIRDGKNDAALRDMGITDAVAADMRQYLQQAAQWDQSGRLVSFDITQVQDPYTAEAFVQAVHRGTSQIIQGTFIGERNAWVHNDWLRLLTQLRSFGITSMEKQWSRTRFNHGYGVAAMMLVAQMVAALPLHLARVQLAAAGREDRKKYLEDNTTPAALLRATMNYASIGGLSGDMLEAISGVVGGWGDKETKEMVGARQTAGGVSRAIPVLGTLDQGIKVATGRADLHTALKQLPFSSVWYLTPIINLTKGD